MKKTTTQKHIIQRYTLANFLNSILMIRYSIVMKFRHISVTLERHFHNYVQDTDVAYDLLRSRRCVMSNVSDNIDLHIRKV